MTSSFVPQALRLRRYRTHWWACWPSEEARGDQGCVVFLARHAETAIARASEFYGLEMAWWPPASA